MKLLTKLLSLVIMVQNLISIKIHIDIETKIDTFLSIGTVYFS